MNLSNSLAFGPGYLSSPDTVRFEPVISSLTRFIVINHILAPPEGAIFGYRGLASEQD